MQKTGLTLPQALRRLKKADDSIREAIGEDIEPRLRELLSSSRTQTRPRFGCSRPTPRGSELMISTSWCSCRNDAGSSVVNRPVDHPRHARRLASPRRDQHDRARLQNRRHSHRQRLGGTAIDVVPEERRVAAARLGRSVTRCVRASSSAPGSLKPMWPLVPMPRICRSMPPASAIARS